MALCRECKYQPKCSPFWLGNGDGNQCPAMDEVERVYALNRLALQELKNLHTPGLSYLASVNLAIKHLQNVLGEG